MRQVIVSLSQRGLIRFGGHRPRGGYDGQNGIKQAGRRVRRQFSEESWSARSGWCWMRGRRWGRGPRARSDAVGAGQLGAAGAGGSEPGQDRPDDRRAHGASAAAQGESRATDGARHPKKKPRPSSPSTRRDVCPGLRRRRPSSRSRDLSDVARLAQRLLCVARAPGIDACARRPSTESAGAGVLRREQTALRESARPRGSPRAHEHVSRNGSCA